MKFCHALDLEKCGSRTIVVQISETSEVQSWASVFEHFWELLEGGIWRGFGRDMGR